jgi:hypothetical protein
MLFGGIRSQVRAHLPVDTGLPEIGTRNRHCPPVDLNHKAFSRAVGEHEAEYQIGNNLKVVRAPVMGDADAQR